MRTNLLLFIMCPLLGIAQMNKHRAQAIIDSVLQHSVGSYQVIDYYTTELGEMKLIQAVPLCDLWGCACNNYNGFQKRFGLINKDGKLLPPVFNGIDEWEGSYLLNWNCHQKGLRYGQELAMVMVDNDYRVTEVFQSCDYSDNTYYARKNGKWGVISGGYYTTIPFEYDSLGEQSAFAEYHYEDWSMEIFTDLPALPGLKNGKWGMILNNGEVRIPFKYDWLGTLRSGKAQAQIKGKYGMISREDSVIIPFEYDTLMQLRSGYAGKREGKWYEIDYKFVNKGMLPWEDITDFGTNHYWFGKKKSYYYPLNEPYYEDHTPFQELKPLLREFMAVRKGRKWAVYNASEKRYLSDFVFKQVVSAETEFVDYTSSRSGPIYYFNVVEKGKEEKYTYNPYEDMFYK